MAIESTFRTELLSVGTVLDVGDKFIEDCLEKKKGNITLGWKGLRQVLVWVKRADLLFFQSAFQWPNYTPSLPPARCQARYYSYEELQACRSRS